MMLKRYRPLASGSKGNATFIETSGGKFLIDAGVSCLQLNKRLELMGESLDRIDGVLITHEHTDHIAGLKTLVQRYNIPLLANRETAQAIYEKLGFCPKFKIFSTGESFVFANVTIHPFSVPHDARDPVGFIIEGKAKLGVCTDLGFTTATIRRVLQGCTHLILEANHHPPMVHASARPPVLKHRILGKTGHLSNEASGELLTAIDHPGLEHVHLAHLSEDCNEPNKALTTVREILGSRSSQIDLHVAPQRELGQEVLVAS